MSELIRTYEVPGDDLSRAGEASSCIKRILKDLGFSTEVIRRTAITTYEAEINMFIHAGGGTVTARISPQRIVLTFADNGPGIPDVDLAMQAGWSTAPANIRNLGFGAGMGLPNIKAYSDELTIDTKVGEGTTLTSVIYVEGRN